MDYYYLLPSPPCRSVLLTAAALGVKLNKIVLNIQEGAHMTPQFLAINPMHTIPTLVDGDFALWESRAICAYLVNQHGKDDSLYPKDPAKRAVVDRMLYFDMGNLITDFGKYMYPALRSNMAPDPAHLEKLQQTLQTFNAQLKGKDYATGSSPTIADHSLVASVSSMEAAGIDLKAHPNVQAWLARCKENLTGYEENEEGAKVFGEYCKGKLAEIAKK